MKKKNKGVWLDQKERERGKKKSCPYLQSQMTKFSSTLAVQSLSHVQLFVTPWTAARQASLSFTISQSLFKLMSIELVMPSKYLILCHLLLPLPSIFPSFRVFLPLFWFWCLDQSQGVFKKLLLLHLFILKNIRGNKKTWTVPKGHLSLDSQRFLF